MRSHEIQGRKLSTITTSLNGLIFFFLMSNKVQPKLDIKPDLQVCKHSLAGGETLLNSC